MALLPLPSATTSAPAPATTPAVMFLPGVRNITPPPAFVEVESSTGSGQRFLLPTPAPAPATAPATPATAYVPAPAPQPQDEIDMDDLLDSEDEL